MAEELNSSELQKDDSASIPRTRLSEIGYTGIKTASGRILEEANRKLRFPQFIREVDEMLNDATIATGMQFTRMMLGRVKWKVVAPVGADAQQLERAKFIETCMHDMEHTWQQFIIELTNYIPYGFSVHEKVWRKRLKTAGSKYNDGLVGWKKLPVRSQSTIDEWEFSDDGREILACYQSTANLTYMGMPSALSSNAKLRIPREKYLLFTADSRLGNPLGKSPLAAVWTQWRYRQEIEKIQAIAAARDLEGIPYIECPSAYMSSDASPDKQEVYNGLKKIAANFHFNAQSGLVFPSDVDSDTKQKLFSMKLLTSEGGGKQQIEETIKRLNSQILMALGADVLALGTDKVGSFSLAGAKTNIATMMLDYRLREIKDVLNNDLIKETFVRNGWSDTILPTIEYEEFDELEPDEASKAFQRLGSIGMLVKDVDTVNAGRKLIGVPALDPDTKIDSVEFSNNSSRAGDGMSKGSGNGTSDEVAATDNSVGNMENS